eukprot:3458153-Amphidinium_carterae.1
MSICNATLVDQRGVLLMLIRRSCNADPATFATGLGKRMHPSFFAPSCNLQTSTAGSATTLTTPAHAIPRNSAMPRTAHG